MYNTVALFWAVCLICIVNMLRYFSSLRALLSILRQADPLLYQSVDGNGFFTTNSQFNKQIRLVRYINSQSYLNHHDPDVILLCKRLRKQFILTEILFGVVVLCLIASAF
ncbi:universal stress protein UspB [Xenorhabdus nematophila]|uniref:Universal stress protein B n=1 Tax=Xenorhabdus nematophila (strain ATCC 19061 / DSM 3370 / CCUG 14189 / LMG 1036 / NCIMB 9965 / AN6) TaxID=406817 RepID=D3VFW4_XENNA|nr:universal stress protein UspB [Xenorhabdus nematophila]CEE92026.1 universal stress protein B [Xenorhabdus nematophila str. Anatoliense]CEF32123.1 universal stress protein B [Xenorhabdus nematophila str. Websteri]AYA41707.1 universal stress protein UspB [Xenorhabdus nematophila]MBA0020445.1 universal stress protein UspB [Xenorhabdus nematophila]MCB4426237.1 universal stress protein UspB [Xenorhabdus nematophila]